MVMENLVNDMNNKKFKTKFQQLFICMEAWYTTTWASILIIPTRIRSKIYYICVCACACVRVYNLLDRTYSKRQPRKDITGNE